MILRTILKAFKAHKINKAVALILVVSSLVMLVGCSGGYTTGGGNGGGVVGDNNDKPSDGNGGNTGDDGEQERVFTVSFTLDGETFVPSEPLTVRWTGNSSKGTSGVFTATTDENGFARVTGLDGDYIVTIVDLPEKYTYNPNIHYTSNVNPDKVVEIFEIDFPNSSNKGTNMYQDVISLSATGEYRVTLTDEEPVYFQFEPVNPGTYYVESWVDITNNVVNPIAHRHEGTTAYKNKTPIVFDGGGASGSFTTNFKITMNVDKSGITTGGSVVFCFGILAELNEGDYPVTIDFVLRYEGTYEKPTTSKDFVIPQELPKSEAEEEQWNRLHDSYSSSYIDVTMSGCAFVTNTKNNQNKTLKLLDASKVKYNEEDGYYHIYDEEAYDGGYGPILYAKITEKNIFIPASDDGVYLNFTSVEAASGTAVLTLCNGTKNYKMFIEGAGAMANAEFPSLCTTDCPCRKNGCGGMCSAGCSSCTSHCKHLPDGLTEYQMRGYAGFANSDGLCPVTQELHDFLVAYNNKQFLFKDGSGYAEGIGYTAIEGGQWLFACCYYNE